MTHKAGSGVLVKGKRNVIKSQCADGLFAVSSLQVRFAWCSKHLRACRELREGGRKGEQERGIDL